MSRISTPIKKLLEELNEHKIFADKNILNKNVSFLNAAQYQDKIYLLFNLIYHGY